MGNNKATTMIALILLALLPMTLAAPQYDRESCWDSLQVIRGGSEPITTIENGVPVAGVPSVISMEEETAVKCANRCKELDDCHVYYYYYETAKGSKTCYFTSLGILSPRKILVDQTQNTLFSFILVNVSKRGY